MKRRTVIVNQPVRRKRNRTRLAVLRLIHLLGSVFFKFSLLVAVITIISFSFLSLYHYLLASPYMKLEHVEVIGVDNSIRAELIERYGLNAENSLIALNLDELKQKMETHPWVRSVRLERQFPDTLVVRAEKEEPRALVLMDKIYYMNRWGEVFKEVSDTEEMDFPIITGVSREGSEVQKQLESTAHLLGILESEGGVWSLNELSEIHLQEKGGMSLYFSHLPAEIKLSCGDLRNKMNGLKKVAEHLTQTGRIHQVTGIDLNYDEGAVVSFRKG
ncbi:MAG TPA: FtsQ-type POTRA domain-containing protein [Acidobacteriota bacterium]|nr:FtsQ-type POTRA domain-containing protein [Acidobacteriota bacterium]